MINKLKCWLGLHNKEYFSRLIDNRYISYWRCRNCGKLDSLYIS